MRDALEPDGKHGGVCASEDRIYQAGNRNYWVALGAEIVDNARMKRCIQQLTAGMILSLVVSCSTVGESPEVIVILPEGEGAGDVGKIDFATQIKPILTGKCLSCHHPNSERTDLSFASREEIVNASGDRPILIPGKPEKSTLFLVTVLPDYFVEAMPASGHQLSEEEKWDLYHWILQGADWPGDDSKPKLLTKEKTGRG